MRAPFAIQSYKHRSLPVSAQRIINWMPELQTPDAKARVILVPTPGLILFVTLPGSPIRGLHVMGADLYAVAGVKVCKVAVDGTFTVLGEIPQGGLVSMDDNGTQLVIVMPENSRAWVVTTTTLQEISDTDFTTLGGASTVTVLNGRHVFTRPDSTEFFLSALNDATDFNALEFASAEASADNLVRALRVGLYLWLFGERTIEVWNAVGAPDDFPFQRASGSLIERGCAAAFSCVNVAGSPFWLGDDRVVYRAEGVVPQRITTHAIDQTIAGYETVSDAVAWTYDQEGHRFYVLSFPSAGDTWVYDLTTGSWHERESEGRGVWRCWLGTQYGGGVIAGDNQDGRLYVLSPVVSDELGEPIIRVATGSCFHSEGRRVFASRLHLDCETGVGLLTGQGSEPVAWLSHSDDGGRTWSSERWARLGRQGAYRTRVEWRRLGAARERVFRIQMSDPVRTTIIAGDFDIEAGAS